MRAIWFLAMKDLRLLCADKVGFFFVFFWPLLFAVFFGFVTGSSSGGKPARALPVCLVDEDRSEPSADLRTLLAGKEALYITNLDDRAVAEKEVRLGSQVALVVIPDGFGAASERPFSGESMELELVVDPSRPMEAAMVQGIIYSAGYEQLQKSFSDPGQMVDLIQRQMGGNKSEPFSPTNLLIMGGMFLAGKQVFKPGDDTQSVATTSNGVSGNTKSGSELAGKSGDKWEPFSVNIRQVGVAGETSGDESGPVTPGTEPKRESNRSWAIVFPQGIIWGVMACAATFGLTLVTERIRGTLPRLTIAPIHHWQILAGKGLACFMSTTTVAAVLLLIANVVFGVKPTSLPLLIMGIMCMSAGIMGMMMLFSVLGKTEAAAGGAAWAVVVIMAMLGGGMMPLAAMKGWMLTLSNFSVFRWAILALEGAIWRDFGFAEMLMPCTILTGIGVGGFLLGAGVFKKRAT